MMIMTNVYNGVVIKDEFINEARETIARKKEWDALSDPSDPWSKGFMIAAENWRAGKYDKIYRDDLLKIAYEIQTNSRGASAVRREHLRQ
jgi:hypothetical protein